MTVPKFMAGEKGRAKAVQPAGGGATVKNPSNHPAWAVMIRDAIQALDERNGSSMQAIKKYILANNQVDPDKVSPHMKRGMRAALIAGSVIQVKGKGMTGSFKLGDAANAIAKPKAPKAAGEKKNTAKKAAYPKKAKPAAASDEEGKSTEVVKQQVPFRSGPTKPPRFQFQKTKGANAFSKIKVSGPKQQ